jgi:hypothetical protein
MRRSRTFALADRGEDLAVANGDHCAERRVSLDSGGAELPDDVLGGDDPALVHLEDVSEL